MTTPNLAEFRNLAQTRRVIPVFRKLLADGETALGLYRKLANERAGTFLLESAEHGGAWSRYSFIGVNCEATLTAENGLATWLGKPPAGAPTGIDPLAALRLSANHLKSPKIAGLPPLTGGLVGYLGYDTVRRLEKLPNLAIDDLQIPELAFMLTTDLAVLDHSDGTITLIANAINWDGSDERVDEAYHAAVARLDQMAKDLASPLPGYLSELSKPASSAIASNISTPEFLAKVAAIKEEILAGEAFQVVLSQRFEIECKAEPIDVYRMLRLHNPSPYIYLFHFADGVSVVGSSPEALVKVTDGEVMVHPIAGTRKRSDSPEEDARLATELLADPKERAEHLMLVDLGRNDLGRICSAGSVEVVDFMHIERYSHVMHIVSNVEARLKPGLNAIDVLRATFPAGTVSGAPKVRAMEIIDELEPVKRCIYAGAVGYLGFHGNMDVAIALRTAVVKDGRLHVQAGGGVVADSQPEAEWQETQNKARALLRAAEMAEAGLDGL